MKKLRLPGFTLIELLIVIGILAILLSIVLIAINPLEQINKSNDVSTNTVAKDFTSAIKYYYTDQKTYPWKADPTCRSELTTGQTLPDVSSCINDLTGGGQLQTSYMAANETKNIYVTECNDAVAVCYSPQSQQFSQSSDNKYTKNGVLNPDCPGGSDCYSCTFSTNDAQECFQALNPNGSVAIVASPTPGQPIPITSRNSINNCSTPGSGDVSCMAKVVSNSGGTPLSSLAVNGGYGPTQIHMAYNLPCTPGGTISAQCPQPIIFGPTTIAVVDAYNDPTAANDLAVYSQTYGLPSCTVTNGCLSIVNQNGATSPLPSTDSNWALEESLDIQMAHAVCQTCKVLLVEAQSNSFADITTAENEAAQMGATAISNSYGAAEWSGETAYDSAYNHPGIFVTVSAGDWGYGAYYPAASKNVIAVGGTTLSLLSNYSYSSESVWNGTGSGCSLYETANTFQTNVSNWNLTGCGTKRGIADVSADADPSTGVAVYDSTAYSGNSGWWILGGTSVSSPIVSAALALTGNAPANTPSSSYVYANPSEFRDITTGSNGSCGGSTACNATSGYDGPTGLGSPKLLSDSSINPTPTTAPSIVPTSTPIHYAIDDTKLLDTYAIFTYPDPGVPTPWNIDVSFRPDFGGVIHDVTDPGNGANADTFTRFAYAATGTIGAVGSESNNALRAITSKYIGIQSTPNIKWGNYQQCGKTLYFRVVNYYDPTEYGPTNSGVIDCTTVVGVVDPPLSWYTVFDQVADQQKQYSPLWDADNNGIINWSDYALMALSTKTRAGGWQPPEITSSSNNTNPTITISPSPTTPPLDCSETQTVTLNQTNTVNANPGDTIYNTLTVKSNDSAGCSATYTISQGFPSGWTISGVPASFILAGGATETIPMTVQVPANATAGNYTYQFWVAKQGQTSVNPVNGNIQVQQVGPTNTPTPMPISCSNPWGQSLGNTSLSGNAGDTLNQTLTITNNDAPGCGSAQYVISYAEPSGFVTNNLPPSVTLAGGQSTTINFTITIATGAQIQDYLTQYWVDNGGNPLNATIYVTGLANPPPQQLFSNFSTRPYGTYALFMFSYNMTGTGDFRLDVATDPSALNQTTGPNSAAMYGFAYTTGNAMDASNNAIPTTTRGFISSSPQSWSGWQCGSTIYYRMYNDGDLRISSPIESTTVDCTTVVNVLSWTPWYAAIYQGVYNSAYDADNNGVVNWTDYWILVKATELR